MHKFSKFISVSLKSGLIAGFVFFSGLQLHAELLDRIVAIVNDDIILQTEYENEFRGVIARLRSQGGKLPPQSQIAQQVLEQMVVDRIQAQRARRAGIQVPDQMVNQMLQRVAQQNKTPINQLPAALAADGIDYASFREDLRKQLASQQLMQREIGSNIRISDSEIDRVLSQGQGDKEFELEHILIAVKQDAPAEAIQRQQKLVSELASRINDGENFAKLAIAYSNGNNALQGGNLGWRDISKVPSLFVEKIRNLKEGQISEPIRSPSGFHLIRIANVRDGNNLDLPPQIVEQYKVRHILLQSDPLRTNEQMQTKLTELRQQIIDGKSFADAALEVSEDPGTAGKGGDLGWSPADKYAPAFENKVKTSAVNTLTEPFQSQFGWHILEVMDKRSENVANETLRNRARVALTEQKFEEEALLWRQRIRDEAYVEYRL